MKFQQFSEISLKFQTARQAGCEISAEGERIQGLRDACSRSMGASFEGQVRNVAALRSFQESLIGCRGPLRIYAAAATNGDYLMIFVVAICVWVLHMLIISKIQFLKCNLM